MSSQSQDNVTGKNIKQVVDMLDTTIQLNDKGICFSPLLHGNHGIGKTQMVEQLAKKYDAEYVVINLASIDLCDLLGSLKEDGTYNRPNWLKDTEKRVIYFLDEINRAPKFILQGIFNFLNEKRIHNFKAKDIDIVISAANPSDTYEVTCFEDPAFLSRFMHIKVAPSQKEFSSFLGGKGGVKNTFIQQALKKSESLYQDTDFSLGFNITPDNRKLHKVALMMDTLTDTEMENVGIWMLECIVGFDASAIILETWRDSLKNQFDPKDILRMSEKKEYPFENNDIEIINNINVKMLSYAKNEWTKKEKEGFKRYIMFIPEDLQVDFLKEMVKVNDSVIELMDTDYAFNLLNLESPNK